MKDYEQIILKRLEEGTLIRNGWTDIDEEGRELACLLAVVAPECGEKQSPNACPADVMPKWLAHLTPWIDDAGTTERWPEFIRRFAAASPKWGQLTERHEYAVRAVCVREAMQHTGNESVLLACQGVVELCDRVAAGEPRDSITDDSTAWVAAAAATVRTAWASSDAAARVAAAARMAAAAATARVAAVDAADAATWAAEATSSKEERAVRKAAADRIIDQILKVLEAA